MKLEDQVCSLELAIKLEKLGVKQDSLFYWYDYSEKNESAGISYTKGKIVGENTCSAFTVAELGEMLPVEIPYTDNGCDDISFLLTGKNSNGKWWLNYTTGVEDANEANVRAKMLIYLIENNLIELPK